MHSYIIPLNIIPEEVNSFPWSFKAESWLKILVLPVKMVNRGYKLLIKLGYELLVKLASTGY